MPEQIRLKVGGISNAQFSVYDEFARNIPGFKAMTEIDAALLMQKVSLPVCSNCVSIVFYEWHLKLDYYYFITDSGERNASVSIQ